MKINFDDAIGGYVTKVGEKIRETQEEFILESLMPYAQTVESRIDKESLSKAIRMYYGKDVQEVKHGERVECWLRAKKRNRLDFDYYIKDSLRAEMEKPR